MLHNDTAAEGGGSTRGKPKKDFDTAWIDGRDPLYTRVADAWMAQIIADFGSDHAWQADAFFGNGTSWGAEEDDDDAKSPPGSSISSRPLYKIKMARNLDSVRPRLWAIMNLQKYDCS